MAETVGYTSIAAVVGLVDVIVGTFGRVKAPSLSRVKNLATTSRILNICKNAKTIAENGKIFKFLAP
jgi:hypothetical protein